jgi:hypothetical protein
MAVTNVDGMLLAAGSLELPDNVNFAYITHPDNPSRILLVAKCFKYRVIDQFELCYELVARGSGSGSHKLNKNDRVRVADAPLYS